MNVSVRQVRKDSSRALANMCIRVDMSRHDVPVLNLPGNIISLLGHQQTFQQVSTLWCTGELYHSLANSSNNVRVGR
jgi:hypothetical protein